MVLFLVLLTASGVPLLWTGVLRGDTNSSVVISGVSIDEKSKTVLLACDTDTFDIPLLTDPAGE